MGQITQGMVGLLPQGNARAAHGLQGGLDLRDAGAAPIGRQASQGQTTGCQCQQRQQVRHFALRRRRQRAQRGIHAVEVRGDGGKLRPRVGGQAAVEHGAGDAAEHAATGIGEPAAGPCRLVEPGNTAAGQRQCASSHHADFQQGPSSHRIECCIIARRPARDR